MTDTTFSPLPIGNTLPVTLAFVDAHGNAGVAPEGVIPSWAVDLPELLTVTPAADGMSASLITVANTGAPVVTVTDGTLTGTLTVTITAGAVSAISIVPGTPVANA